MIIKGSSRGGSAADIRELAAHLLADENEAAEVLEIKGVAAGDLAAALEEMRVLSLSSRTVRSVYHASINVGPDECAKMTPARWREAVSELEQRLGLTGHQRAVVRHVKRGREHLHVVWGRVHPVTLKTASDGNFYRRHEECARALEERWGLRPVVGVHTRIPGSPRPVAAATHGDWQAQERTGVKVASVADTLKWAWGRSRTGKEFLALITNEGLCLANGRRGIVVVDAAGTPHSLSRRLGLKAAAVRGKLRDLNPAALPTVDEAKARVRGQTRERRTRVTRDQKGAIGCPDGDTSRRKPPPDYDEIVAYWSGLGLDAARRPGGVWIMLSDGGHLHDQGDRVTIHRDGEPTDDDIRLIVAAGRARGWQSIRFFGGSEDFQRRARLEALRQGYSWDQVSLECEDGKPKTTAGPMPEHLSRRLGIPTEPIRDPVTMTAPPPPSTDGVRP